MKFLMLPNATAQWLSIHDELPRRILHHSGDLWIAGDWLPGECVAASSETIKIVLLGTVGCDDQDLAAWLHSQGSEPDIAHVYRAVPGSYFTLVSTADRRTQIYGTLSSFRRVSYSTDPARPIASNSLRYLVELFTPRIREDRVPLALIAPRAPWPLGEASHWHGIENLLPNELLNYDDAGAASTRTRWRIPHVRIPLADAAQGLQAALHGAIEARARHARTSLSSDLSGGMDSTSLAFFANQHVPRLTTMHLSISVEMNDDAEWAAEAAQVLGSRHVRVDHSELPRWFAGWHATEPRFMTEPVPSIRTEGMHRAMATKLSELGCTMHLAGSGGDELFYPDEAILPGLRREAPRALPGAIRSMATLHRWTLTKTARAAMFNSTHGEWLTAQIGQLADGTTDRPSPAWDVPFSLPPWVNHSVVDALETLLDAGARVHAIDSINESDSLAYGMITRNGQIHRTLDEETREVGVRYEAPFLDDLLIEKALQVRLQDRLNTERFKPGLAAASRGVVPEQFLNRRSKGDYISLVYTAFNEYRRHINDELPRFRLVERGYLDPVRFSDFLLSMQPRPDQFFPFEFLLAAERWLRSADDLTRVLKGDDDA